MDRRVLVADDEETICCILEHELTDAGFEVVVAKDGARALELLEAHVFDVAVVDINMPFANGFRVLERTREGDGPPPIVIMITAYGTIESAVRAMQMGSSDYITKPFDCEVLVKKIN